MLTALVRAMQRANVRVKQAFLRALDYYTFVTLANVSLIIVSVMMMAVAMMTATTNDDDDDDDNDDEEEDGVSYDEDDN
ncbi:hypothetical protein ElyMa_000311900 [Elysia marginata]|uniref:Uncharacterized protein n=1 Tax=Elysia marginata TaxID=1093978 RepID=A0AAV4FAR4_9GAST|nr:hypothetical protein ElyMa_000311900 [Elysia marginata]